ncbi:KTSC domain-containing protein [Fortiea contorta]|uniref:KTSC domain-containing protein n=1 Tax=Fortiea contorta TaxID=1892405 RepID=UPI000346135C|nr:KTSC domain-containing protein [Fortiea contorta]
MKLSKVDLSDIIAIAHADGHLQLLLNRGDELDLLEIPAPLAAYEGLQQLHEIISESTPLPIAPEPIAMLPVSSAMASAVGYDSDEQILQVEFHTGAVYQYSGVDLDTWEDFHESDSIGRFFNQEIKGQFCSERID